MRNIQYASDLHQWQEEIRSRQRLEAGVVYVCGGTGCQAYGCQKVKEAFEKELKSLNGERKIVLKYTGCPGFCEKGPLVTLNPQDLFYQKVRPEDVPRIVEETILRGKVGGFYLVRFMTDHDHRLAATYPLGGFKGIKDHRAS